MAADKTRSAGDKYSLFIHFLLFACLNADKCFSLQSRDTVLLRPVNIVAAISDIALCMQGHVLAKPVWFCVLIVPWGLLHVLYLPRRFTSYFMAC